MKGFRQDVEQVGRRIRQLRKGTKAIAHVNHSYSRSAPFGAGPSVSPLLGRGVRMPANGRTPPTDENCPLETWADRC